MSDSDPDGQLVRVEQGTLALARLADNRILSEMVGASLALARDSTVAPIDLDALVREGKRLYRSKGDEMTVENVRAFTLFLRAAEANHNEAQWWLGECYYYGHGVPQDHVEAVEWFRKSADQGNADAQKSLGTCYSKGLGVSEDQLEAAKWYRRAAEQGDAVCQRIIGRYVEAAKSWRKTAEQGSAKAQTNLGVCYDKGLGVPQDYLEAVRWYSKAAEQGNADAQNNLGGCFECGRGVTMDMLEAYNWYQLAADQGQKRAKEKATSLAALMSPSEFAASYAFYREFKDKHSSK